MAFLHQCRGSATDRFTVIVYIFLNLEDNHQTLFHSDLYLFILFIFYVERASVHVHRDAGHCDRYSPAHHYPGTRDGSCHTGTLSKCITLCRLHFCLWHFVNILVFYKSWNSVYLKQIVIIFYLLWHKLNLKQSKDYF